MQGFISFSREELENHSPQGVDKDLEASMQKALHIETPLIESTLLSQWLNKPVYLKMENAQPTGSFKIRGIGRLCQEYAKQGATSFICPSGGNAGLAAAYAAKRLGIACKIVIPRSTPILLKRIIEAEGAEVIVFGDEWNSADARAQELALGEGCFYVPPYDNPIIWEGNSTMVDEIVRRGIKPDCILLSVGGGGLLIGVVEGLRRNRWSDVPIITVETLGAESFAESLRQNKLVTLPHITSIAVTLGCKKVAERAFSIAHEHEVHTEVISDQRAVAAALHFADDHRVIVEPACGVTLSLIYDQARVLERFRSICVIVCGGAGVTFELLQKWHSTFSPQA